jgi:hypothetical protein
MSNGMQTPAGSSSAAPQQPTKGPETGAQGTAGPVTEHPHGGTGPVTGSSTTSSGPVTRPTETGSAGWVYFAGVMLLLLGAFQLIEGLTALFHSSYLLVTSNGLLVTANLAAWGWLHLVIGVVALVAGYGSIVGKRWAQILGIVLAGVSAVVNLTWIAAYPLWSITIIAVDILIIHALAVHGREVQNA